MGRGATFCFVGEESINFAGGAVVGDDGEAFVIHVQNEVLALPSRDETG